MIWRESDTSLGLAGMPDALRVEQRVQGAIFFA
jgi:hypothetical protein